MPSDVHSEIHGFIDALFSTKNHGQSCLNSEPAALAGNHPHIASEEHRGTGKGGFDIHQWALSDRVLLEVGVYCYRHNDSSINRAFEALKERYESVRTIARAQVR